MISKTNNKTEFKIKKFITSLIKDDSTFHFMKLATRAENPKDIYSSFTNDITDSTKDSIKRLTDLDYDSARKNMENRFPNIDACTLNAVMILAGGYEISRIKDNEEATKNLKSLNPKIVEAHYQVSNSSSESMWAINVGCHKKNYICSTCDVILMAIMDNQKETLKDRVCLLLSKVREGFRFSYDGHGLNEIFSEFGTGKWMKKNTEAVLLYFFAYLFLAFLALKVSEAMFCISFAVGLLPIFLSTTNHPDKLIKVAACIAYLPEIIKILYRNTK